MQLRVGVIALLVIACGFPRAIAGPSEDQLEQRATELRQRLKGQGFTVVVEPPFVVVGDESPRRVRRRASGILRWSVDRYERELFDRGPSKVIEVWLFRNERTYRRGARKHFGDVPTTPYGYYSSDDDAIVMNIGPGAGTLTHEIVHPFIEADFPAAPAWMNEGIASLYERPSERDGKIWGLPNWRLPNLKREIRADTLPPISALIATTSEEFYNAGFDSYAYARYLIMYLQEHDKLTEFYKAFRAGAADDPSGALTLAKVLDIDDLDAFGATWRTWVLGLKT